jgi:hypothetical protein
MRRSMLERVRLKDGGVIWLVRTSGRQRPIRRGRRHLPVSTGGRGSSLSSVAHRVGPRQLWVQLIVLRRGRPGPPRSSPRRHGDDRRPDGDVVAPATGAPPSPLKANTGPGVARRPTRCRRLTGTARSSRPAAQPAGRETVRTSTVAPGPARSARPARSSPVWRSRARSRRGAAGDAGGLEGTAAPLRNASPLAQGATSSRTVRAA